MSSKEEPLFSSASTMTCTLASLADAHARTGTEVDNSSLRYRAVWISFKSKLQGTPGQDNYVEIWGLRSDGEGSPNKDGNYGNDTDYTVALRPRGGVFLGIAPCDTAATPLLDAVVRFPNPGKAWNVMFINRSGAAISATGSDSVVKWFGENPEAQ